MDSRRVALYGVLGISLLVAFFFSPLTRGLFQRKPPAAPASTRAPAPGPAEPRTPPALAETPRLSEAELAAWRRSNAEAWGRDPFFTLEEERALEAPKVATPAPKGAAQPATVPAQTVKLLLISESDKWAAIDDTVVSEGEMLGEERVVEIGADGVVLERDGRRRRIEVSGGAVPLVRVGPR